MLKKYLSIILSLSLVMAPYASAQETQGVSNTERYAFLRAVGKKVKMTLTANVVTLEGYQECFEGSPNPECEEIIEKVKREVEIKYPEIQRISFLLSFFTQEDLYRPKTMQTMFQYFRNDLLNDTRKYNIRGSLLRKPVYSPISDIDSLSHLPPVNFSKNDIERIMNVKNLTFDTHNSEGEKIKSYPLHANGIMQMVCENYMIHKKKESNRAARVLRRYHSRNSCKYFDLRYDKAADSFAFYTSQITTRNENNSDHTVYFGGLNENDINNIFKPMWDRTWPTGRRSLRTENEQLIYEPLDKPLRIMKRILKERFFETISDVPYVALVPSAKPTNRQLATAFKLMRQNAQKELDLISQQYRQAFLGEEVSPTLGQRLQNTFTLSNGQRILETIASPAFALAGALFGSDETERESFQINWYRAHQFMSFTPIAEELLEYPDSNMLAMEQAHETDFESVYDDTYGTYSSDQLWDLGTEIAGAIGLTAACFVPVGRIAAGGGRAFRLANYSGRGTGALVRAHRYGRALKNSRMGMIATRITPKGKLNARAWLCLPGTSILVNSYFLSEAEDRYNSVYRRIFSTIEGQTLLTELDQLTDAEYGLVIEMVLWPLGVGVIGSLRHLSTKLSSRSYNYLRSAVGR